MLLKLLFLMMVCQRGAASEELLHVLGGVQGGNRVSLCLGGAGGRCAGALWRDQWVVTRASCLEHQLMFKVLVLRDGLGVSCQDYDKLQANMGREYLQARKVRVQFVHPEHERSPRRDVALLGISGRYWSLDRLANTSSGNKLLSELEPWMEEVYQKYPMDPYRIVSYEHKSCLFSTPIRMFMTTIMLPSVSFILFFLYVIFYTGPKDEIPYKSIQQEKCNESEDGQLENNGSGGDSPLEV